MVEIEGELKIRLEHLLDEISHACLPLVGDDRDNIQLRARFQVSFARRALRAVNSELDVIVTEMNLLVKEASEHESDTAAQDASTKNRSRDGKENDGGRTQGH